MIQIYYDTSTYEAIVQDNKVTLDSGGLIGLISVIGGTMGLLTGFSILSGVEIIYYLVKLFMSLRSSRAQIAQGNLPKKIGSQIF